MSTATALAPAAPAAAGSASAAATLRAVTLLALVAVTLPLGSAGPAARAAFVTGLGALATLVLLRTWLVRGGLFVPPGSAPAAAFLGLAALQLLPIGGAPLAGLGDVAPTALSLVPAHTAARLGELCACAGVVLVVAHLFDRTAAARTFVGSALAFGCGLVVYGVLAWHGVVPLLDPIQTDTVLVATFVNRNHTANLFVVLALLGTGLAAAQAARGSSALRRAATLVALVVLVLGVVATQSRGALLALVGGGLVFGVLASPSLRRWRTLALSATVAATLALWLLPADVQQRFLGVGAELKANGTRPDIWRGAFALWQMAPVLGTGLGTFGDLSPATQSAAVPGRIEHAHCDPLEFLVETGAVGALLLLWLLVATGRRLASRCRTLPDRERALLATGAVAAVAAVLMHAAVEFPLQIPATAAWAAATAGIAIGLCRARSLAPQRSPSALAGIALAVVATALGLVRTLGPGGSDAVALTAHGRRLLATDPAAAAAAANAALADNPFSPRAHRLLGDANLGRDAAAAEAAYRRAILWTNAAERDARQLEIAIACLQAGSGDLAARWLTDLLPRLPEPRLRAALAALHDALPIAEAVLALLPDATDVRTRFAEVLLQRGDFAGRESVLATIGARAVVPLTLSADALLTEATVARHRTDDALELHVAFTFARGREAAAVPLVLRCDGPGAAIYRSFAAEAPDWKWTLRLDTAFPPGRYELSLDFRADAPHWPFDAVEVAEADLDLRAGTTVAASQLYWTTALPGRRIRPTDGVPLRDGDELWRRVLLPGGPGELAVHSGRPTRLAVRLDDVELRCANDAPARLHRFVLPEGATAGRLAIVARDGDDPVVRELFVTRKGTR